MLHSKHVTLTANKTEANLTKTRFKVNKGLIYQIWLTFPAGCRGLVKVRVLHEGHPFLPVEKDANIVGDNYTYVYFPFYEIKQAPQQITVEAWNEDEIHDHTIHLQMLIIDKKWILPFEGALEFLKLAITQNKGGK